MDTRPIKRARVDDNDWPLLFDITDLAKLVFEYVPKMQCRQFVRDSKGILQYKICLWMPQQDIDLEIQNAILKADNVLCLQFVHLNLSTLTEYPLPNMLPHILPRRHKSNISHLTWHRCLPHCNLQLLAQQWWTQDELQEHIYMTFSRMCSKSKLNENLKFLLQFLKMPVEIGRAMIPLDPELWSFLRPFLTTGLLTMDKTSIEYLASMPREIFDCVPKSAYHERISNLLKVCIEHWNWDIANLIWNPHLAQYVCYKLTSSIQTPVQCYGGHVRVCDDSMFECMLHWKHPFSSFYMQSLQYLDSTLEFLEPIDSSGLQHVIDGWMQAFLNGSFVKIKRVFKRSCLLGYANIISKIWRVLPELTFKNLLSRCRFCDNLATLEFAWSIIETDIRNDALRWTRCAYNIDNVVLWQFLFSKGILPINLLFDNEIKIEHSSYLTFGAKNIVQSLGRKPVAMLATIWNVPGVQDPNNLTGMIHEAADAENRPVLEFLNAKHVRLQQSTLVRHFPTLCAYELHNLLSQIDTNPFTSTYDMYRTYANAPVSVYQALWQIAPIEDPICFLQTSKVTFDMCVFFLKNRVIDATTLVATLQQDTHANKPLLDDIRAFTYCDADE